jgi:hypothetical protein
MKPSRKKVKAILFDKFMEKVREEEEKLNQLREELYKFVSGELEIDVHDYKDKKWYLGARGSRGSTIVYEFIDK